MFKLEKSTAKSFEFEFEGETYSIPSRESLPMARFREIRAALAGSDNSEETLFDEIMRLFDEYVPDVMARIDLGQAMKLFQAYSVDDDGANLGES